MQLKSVGVIYLLLSQPPSPTRMTVNVFLLHSLQKNEFLSAFTCDTIFQIAPVIAVLNVWIENSNCLVERESYEICKHAAKRDYVDKNKITFGYNKC